MVWEINGTDRFADWFGDLEVSEQDAVIAVVELLAEHGPQLDRPYADRIAGGQALPDPVHVRSAPPGILLVGGDKSGQWSRWYSRAIPEAERLYEGYLAELEAGGFLDDTE